ncbi:MAG: cupin domain-containing protein [Leptolyngbyaceae cyanobacterium CSU_1_3]|nr:cupin domain-containing protein [Leptolyngbyaceae cyanobacterium CSU_1_3]
MSTTHSSVTTVVVQLLQRINYDKPGVSRQVIAKDEHTTSALVCIAAGTLIPEHSAPRTVCLTVLDGCGTLTLEGQDIALEPGVFVRMLPNVPHALQAIDNLALLHV